MAGEAEIQEGESSQAFPRHGGGMVTSFWGASPFFRVILILYTVIFSTLTDWFKARQRRLSCPHTLGPSFLLSPPWTAGKNKEGGIVLQRRMSQPLTPLWGHCRSAEKFPWLESSREKKTEIFGGWGRQGSRTM